MIPNHRVWSCFPIPKHGYVIDHLKIILVKSHEEQCFGQQNNTLNNIMAVSMNTSPMGLLLLGEWVLLWHSTSIPCTAHLCWTLCVHLRFIRTLPKCKSTSSNYMFHRNLIRHNTSSIYVTINFIHITLSNHLILREIKFCVFREWWRFATLNTGKSYKFTLNSYDKTSRFSKIEYLRKWN